MSSCQGVRKLVWLIRKVDRLSLKLIAGVIVLMSPFNGYKTINKDWNDKAIKINPTVAGLKCFILTTKNRFAKKMPNAVPTATIHT